MKIIRPIFSVILIILTLSIMLPAATVQGELEADYSISVLRKADIATDHWEVYVKEDISFIASSDEAQGYTWDFGDGVTEYRETSTISHNYSQVGKKYTVILTVNDDNNNTASKYGNITIVDRPEAILMVTDESGNSLAPDHTINLGESVILDASNSKGDIITYFFGINLPNAFKSQVSKEQATYTHKYESEGSFNVGLKVVDKLGNNSQMEKSEFITITVKKSKTTGDSSFELPVPLEFLAGGILLIVIIGIVAVLYRNGYIGGPIMMGGGGSTSSDEKKSETSSGKTSDPDSFMGGSGGQKPVLPDLDSLMTEQKMKGFGKPEEEKTVYEVKNCPKCKGKIPITSLERPLKVICPDCSASFSLKGKPKGTPVPAVKSLETPATPSTKKDFIYDVKTCPKCKSKIPITSQERPFKVTCPGCSASFTLKGKSTSGQQGKTTGKSIPPPVDDTEIVICPACGKAQPVSASAHSAECISCNATFEL